MGDIRIGNRDCITHAALAEGRDDLGRLCEHLDAALRAARRLGETADGILSERGYQLGHRDASILDSHRATLAEAMTELTGAYDELDEPDGFLCKVSGAGDAEEAVRQLPDALRTVNGMRIS